MKKSQNAQQVQQRPAVMDATGKGAFDATGRGAFLGTMPVADQNTAMMNQQSLRPMSGGVDFAQKMMAQAQGGEQESEETSMNEAFGSLFDGENLSEEFKGKAAVVFQAALNERVAAMRNSLVKESATILEHEVHTAVNDLATRLDEYLNYVVEEWLKDNKLAVESGIRTEIAESFIGGLRSLFETHYIEVPEKKHDVLEDLFSENQKLEESLNEQIQSNIELNKQITAGKARAIFLETVSGMSSVDAERLASLAESVEFSNAEDFQNKLLILKENYLRAAPVIHREPEVITEQTYYAPVDANVNAPMAAYMNALSRQTKTY
jgi:hypothetical protein